MMKFEINGHQFNVPTSWSDITLGEYEKWYASRPQTRLDYVHYIARICGIEPDLLLSASAELFDTICSKMEFILDTNLQPAYMVEIDHEKYFVSPSDKLTLGEWVDVDTLMNSQDSDQQLSQMLAIVCRPVAEEYEPEKANERAQLFRMQPCDKMLPLVSFFLFREKQLSETLNHCSEVVAQANRFLRDTKSFAKSGDGIKRLPIWQRIKYYFLIKSLEKQLSRFSDFCSIG